MLNGQLSLSFKEGALEARETSYWSTTLDRANIQLEEETTILNSS